MAAPPSFAAILAALMFFVSRVESTWCVARSEASDQALQAGLDYACGFGADCAPIMSDGLCYLPNTLLAHASYAYNSYYQRRGRAPGSCDFSGTANIARTDPSYGSCIYPSKPSAAGGTVSPGRPITPLATQPTLYPPPSPAAAAEAANQRSGRPVVPNKTTTENSGSPPMFSITVITTLIPVSFVLLVLHVFQRQL